MTANGIAANLGKKLEISIGNKRYLRLPIRTHVISKHDNIVNVCIQYTDGLLSKTDVLFVSEKIVAISQGRAYEINTIKPGILAQSLSRFVFKSPHGIGLGSKYTMQLAIEEAGVLRILLGSAIAAVTKPFGLRGMFYRVVGNNINAIDGPCAYTIPPYNTYAKLPPKNPEKVAKEISEKIGCPTVIIDANDLGVNVLGKSGNISNDFCVKAFADNPLGQSNEQTPLCIVREVA